MGHAFDAIDHAEWERPYLVDGGILRSVVHADSEFRHVEKLVNRFLLLKRMPDDAMDVDTAEPTNGGTLQTVRGSTDMGTNVGVMHAITTDWNTVLSGLLSNGTLSKSDSWLGC